MLAAADLARAKAWYAEKLGFKPVAEYEGAVVTFHSGDSMFRRLPVRVRRHGEEHGRGWRLRGLRDEVARLRGNGVEFEEYDFGDDERTVGGILSDAEGDLRRPGSPTPRATSLAIAEDRT